MINLLQPFPVLQVNIAPQLHRLMEKQSCHDFGTHTHQGSEDHHQQIQLLFGLLDAPRLDSLLHQQNEHHKHVSGHSVTSSE